MVSTNRRKQEEIMIDIEKLAIDYLAVQKSKIDCGESVYCGKKEQIATFAEAHLDSWLYETKLIDGVNRILEGIDAEEGSNENGWWETSYGAEFGQSELDELCKFIKERQMMKYQIFEGSQSTHCCFDATVVDTTKPEMVGGEQYKGEDGQLHYKAICECFNRDDAVRICEALNAAESH
jgi:hypothetical protein